jgi:hypothetical protein
VIGMLKFFGRQWRGEAPFWISVLVVSLILPLALIVGGTQWLSADTIESTPQRSIITVGVIFSIIAVVGVWQLVGTWRASSKSKAPDRWWITRWAGRLVAVAGFALTAFVLSTVPANMARFYSEMQDTDFIGQQGHTLTIDGDKVIITGQLSWGLYDKFVEALKKDEVQTVVLNSLGGHYAVGRRMAVLINENGLDTLTTETCASACTFAFLGGHNRMLQSGARLGYHAPSGNTDHSLGVVGNHMTGILRAAAVPDDFIQRALATPADKVWFPTAEELQQANIVTEVIE